MTEQIRLHLYHGLAVLLGLVWLYAGGSKLRARRATEAAVGRLTGAPPALARPAAVVLPLSELALGAVLIVGWFAFAAALISVALFTLFAVLIVVAAARGAVGEEGCGCFGLRPTAGTPDFVAGRAVARNLILAALAVAVMGGGHASHSTAAAPPSASSGVPAR